MANLTSDLSSFLSPEDLQKMLATREAAPYASSGPAQGSLPFPNNLPPTPAPVDAAPADTNVADAATAEAPAADATQLELGLDAAPEAAAAAAPEAASAAEAIAPASLSALQRAKLALSSLKGEALDAYSGTGGAIKDLAKDALSSGEGLADKLGLSLLGKMVPTNRELLQASAGVGGAGIGAMGLMAGDDLQEAYPHPINSMLESLGLRSPDSMPLQPGFPVPATDPSQNLVGPVKGHNDVSTDESDEAADALPGAVRSGMSLGMRGPAGGPASGQGAQAPATNATPYDNMSALINRLYDPRLQMMAAQAGNQQQLLANMGKAGALAASALSRGALPYQAPVSEDIEKNANSAMQNLQGQREAALQKMQSGVQLSDLTDKLQMRSADSPVSQAYRNMALQLNPKLANMPGFNQMTAEGVKALEPMVDISIRSQMLHMQMQNQHMWQQMIMEQKAGPEAANRISQMLSRGMANNKALDADRRIDNIMLYAKGIDPATGKPLDLNHLTSQQDTALEGEMQQLFNGAQALSGQHGMIIPSTFLSKAKDAWTTVSGQPTSSGRGQFIQNFVPYLQEFQQNSRAFLGKQIESQINLYGKSFPAVGAALRADPTYSMYLDALNRQQSKIAPDSAGGGGTLVHINGVAHMVPPGTDMDALKATVQQHGGTLSQ